VKPASVSNDHLTIFRRIERVPRIGPSGVLVFGLSDVMTRPSIGRDFPASKRCGES
jgi:hypothetical protein